MKSVNPQVLGQIAAGAEKSASWQIIASAPAKATVSIKAWADNADETPLKSAEINIVPGMLTGADAAEKISVTFPEEMDGIYGEGHVVCPVNTANGAYVLAKSLITVNGAQPVDFMVHYNALLLHEEQLGRGWGHNYETRAEVQQNGDVIIHWDNSRKNSFINNSGVFAPADLANTFDSLIRNPDGTYTLSKQDQTVYNFDSAGKLVESTNGHGQHLTMSYDGSGRLTAVAEPVSGQSLTIAYDTNGRIGSVSDRAGRSVSFSYDTYRNLTGITDPNGKRTTYTYTSDGRLFKIRTPEGLYQITNSYDDQGRVAVQDDAVGGNQPTNFIYDETSQPGKIIATVIDRNGQTKVFTYDDKYQLLSVRDELGNTVSYQYDENGNRITETDAASRTTGYTYDAHGNLLTVTDPAGHVTRMTYDDRNNFLSLENSAGKRITYQYDLNNNLLSITDPMNKTTFFTYDTNSLLLSANRPDLGTTTYNYQNGLLKTVTDPENSTISYSYDGVGRVTGITNSAGKTTQFAYDNTGNLLSATNPLSNSVSYTYDSKGNMLTKTDAKGKITRYTYNGNNKILSVINPLGNTTRYEYDGEDRLKRIVDARGNAVTMNYDAKGRLISAVDSLGNATTYVYNAVDTLVSQKDAMSRQVLSISYDAVNNPLTVTDALSRTVTHQYDVLSRLTKVTDPLSRATQFQHDDMNRLVLTTDAMSGQGRQSFDAAGNRTSLTDPNNNQSTYDYDNAGRLVSSTSAAGRTVSYGYNTQNLISQVTNGRGQTVGYQYDDAGRVVSITRPEGTVSYNYDANGNVLTVTDGSGVITREYDALNRVTKYTDSRGNIIKYGFDAVGNITTLTYPGGKQVKYDYDAANRLTKVTDWAGRVTVYEYDANSRLVKTTRPDGTVLTGSYDAAGQLLQQKDIDQSGSVILKYDYTYDAAGNITSEESGTETPLAVDSVDMTYTSDNRLADYNGQAVEYDADGNMTLGPLGGGMAVFAYDSLNRLTGVQGTSYVYDAEDNRISVTDSVYQSTTNYVVNPHATLSQVLTKADGQGQTYYIYGLGLIGQQESDGTYKTYHYDYRGSTVALTDVNGSITDRFQYGPYGEVTRRMGGTDTPFLYCGNYGVMHDGNGLYYMRARYYDPEVGRFINQDRLTGSIDDTRSLNRFAYVKGGPISKIDPLGLWDEKVHYDDTKQMATELFGPDNAEIIAYECDAIDTYFDTNPFNPFERNQSWHFDTSQKGPGVHWNRSPEDIELDSRMVHVNERFNKAVEAYNSGNVKKAFRYLGQACHPLQDIDAHFKWDIKNGIRIHGTDNRNSSEWNDGVDTEFGWNSGFYDDRNKDYDCESGKWING
ncbi:MAG: RHS repeat-associated core domain-containing protein, partial [Desulfocucumaceae bacterium]